MKTSEYPSGSDQVTSICHELRARRWWFLDRTWGCILSLAFSYTTNLPFPTPRVHHPIKLCSAHIRMSNGHVTQSGREMSGFESKILLAFSLTFSEYGIISSDIYFSFQHFRSITTACSMSAHVHTHRVDRLRKLGLNQMP